VENIRYKGGAMQGYNGDILSSHFSKLYGKLTKQRTIFAL